MSTLMPVRRLFSTTLTTPAIAPEPYVAEAPPVTTSMRCTRFDGMEFMSTTSAWFDEETTRRPSIIVSVREPKAGSMPRRLAMVLPMK
jgi:hypothetical protein